VVVVDCISSFGWYTNTYLGRSTPVVVVEVSGVMEGVGKSITLLKVVNDKASIVGK